MQGVKGAISDSRFGGWGKYQTAQEMETNRKYEYDSEFVPFICRWLGLSSRPSSMVIDVGCGSGYFTKIIARCMRGKGRVFGMSQLYHLRRCTKGARCSP